MSSVFIVGGGASLRDFDFDCLKKQDTITVNHSLFHVPNPKYWITMDYSFVEKLKLNKELWDKFILTEAVKFFVANLSPGSGLQYTNNQYNWKGKLIYDLSDIDYTVKSYLIKNFGTWKYFAHGQNSGFCAVQLAICLGYTQIYLLGIDLCIDKGKTHYHELYNSEIQTFNDLLQRYYENFYFSIRDYRGKSKIYSCSEISRLNDFVPYKNIKEIL